MYIISHSALSVRVFSVLPRIHLLLQTSCQTSPPHVLPVVSKSLFSLCNGNPLPTFWLQNVLFHTKQENECRYPFPFPCRFSINSLEFNFYLHYLRDFCGIYIPFLFPLERMSPNIQSVQNVLNHTDRAPHWVPEMSWYSTSSSISIFALDYKSLSLMFCALGSTDVKRVLTKLFF